MPRTEASNRAAADERRATGEPAPHVSILMPNYNGETHLAAAVASALGQDYPSFELIVVDDGSTDRSREILARIATEHPGRMKVLTHDGQINRGLIETYRLALSRAEGSIVAFHESDDLWRSDNLRQKVAVLHEHPDVGVVHADYRAFGNFRGALYWRLYGWTTRRSLPTGRPYEALGAFLVRNPIPSFTHFVVRRSLLDGLPELTFFGRAYDWWVLAHLSARTRFYFLPEQLTSWRIHRTSSHYGPAKVPFDSLSKFLFALYDSLLATEEVRQQPRRTTLVQNARNTAATLAHLAREDRKGLLLLALRHPLISVAFLIDTVVRRVLFTSVLTRIGRGPENTRSS